MRPTVTYTPYATSSKEQTGNVITFAQFEEGNLLTETCNDSESGDEYYNKSIIMSEQDMENLNEKKTLIKTMYVRKRYMTFVAEIRPIRTLIKGKNVLKYVITLSKMNINGKEP